jgi:hypothetical protein
VNDPEFRMVRLRTELVVVMVVTTAMMSQSGAWDGKHERHDAYGRQQTSLHGAFLLDCAFGAWVF